MGNNLPNIVKSDHEGMSLWYVTISIENIFDVQSTI